MHGPGIIEIKCFDFQLRLVSFSQHEDVGLDLAQLRARRFRMDVPVQPEPIRVRTGRRRRIAESRLQFIRYEVDAREEVKEIGARRA